MTDSEQEKAKQWLDEQEPRFGSSDEVWTVRRTSMAEILASYASSQLSSKEAELAELKADIEPLQAAPLCGNHAQVWYTMRSTIETKSGCFQCDALSELTLLREQVERLTSERAGQFADEAKLRETMGKQFDAYTALETALRNGELAIRDYFLHYMQDEASSVDECVCGERQHQSAKAVKDWLDEVLPIVRNSSSPSPSTTQEK